jgi:hypothetical protein
MLSHSRSIAAFDSVEYLTRQVALQDKKKYCARQFSRLIEAVPRSAAWEPDSRVPSPKPVRKINMKNRKPETDQEPPRDGPCDF